MARLIDALDQIFDGGSPLANGLLDFYETGGSTVRKTTYADNEETIPNSNPVVIGGDGVVPNVFGSGSYRLILRTAAGAQLRQRDPVGGDDFLGFGSEWSLPKTYGLADVVKEDGEYWESQTGVNTGNKPSLDSGTNWLLFLAGVATNAANIATKANLSSAAFTGPISTITTNTALSDAAATLTAAQLIGGEFTITPTVARIQTTDTAANIIAAMTNSVDGSSFDITMVNLAAFDVSIAAGAGVTLVGNMAVNNGNAIFRVRQLSSSTVSVTRLASGTASGGIFIASDTKSNGTGGGNSVSGTQTRTINTVTKNTIAGASLAGNQITLPAGEFLVYASATAYRCNAHQAWLTNVTDTTNDIIGGTEYANATNLVSNRTFINGPLSLSGEKVFSMTHFTQTVGVSGLGSAASSGQGEIYSKIEIEKIG